MALAHWILDKSAAARSADPQVLEELTALAGLLFVCPVGELEQLYSARTARDYDQLKDDLHANFEIASPPADIFSRALRLQQDLAHHHGMWHRTAIPDLLIAETALNHGMGVVHVDGDFDRRAEVRLLVVRRLRLSRRLDAWRTPTNTWRTWRDSSPRREFRSLMLAVLAHVRDDPLVRVAASAGRLLRTLVQRQTDETAGEQ